MRGAEVVTGCSEDGERIRDGLLGGFDHALRVRLEPVCEPGAEDPAYLRRATRLSPPNQLQGGNMFHFRFRLGLALAVVVVLAAALLPAAGATARGIEPKSPWYAYDAALRKAQHQRLAHVLGGIEPKSPWYAYDAALRKAQHQRLAHVLGGIEPKSPWYAYDAALRKAKHLRLIEVLQSKRVG